MESQGSFSAVIPLDRPTHFESLPSMGMSMLGFDYYDGPSDDEKYFSFLTSRGPINLLLVAENGRQVVLLNPKENLSDKVLQDAILPWLSVYVDDWANALQQAGLNTRGIALPMDEEVSERARKLWPERFAEKSVSNDKEQALHAYAKHYETLWERMDRMIAKYRKSFSELPPADLDGYARLRTDAQRDLDDLFGIIRENLYTGVDRYTMSLLDAGFSNEEILDLRDKYHASSIESDVGDRWVNFRQEVEMDFTEKLKRYGKELLNRMDDDTPPERMAAAVFWKHGIAVREDSPQIKKNVQDILEKNLESLISRIGENSNNPASQEIFMRMTGIVLGKKQKERVAQISAWAGEEKVQEMKLRQMQVEQERQKELMIDEVQSAWRGLKEIYIDTEKGSMRGQEYVQWKVENGQDRFTSRKEGARTVYLLSSEQGQVSGVRSPVFTRFAKAVFAMDPHGKVREAMEQSGLGEFLPQAKPLPQAPQEPDEVQDAALTTKIQSDSGIYRLSILEKDGHLLGYLQEFGPDGQAKTSAASAELVFGDVGGFNANITMEDGRRMVVYLSRSGPSEDHSAQVDVHLFARGTLDGRGTLTRVNGTPARLEPRDTDHLFGIRSPEIEKIERALGISSQAMQAENPEVILAEDTDEFSMSNMAAMAAMLDEENAQAESNFRASEAP